MGKTYDLPPLEHNCGLRERLTDAAIDSMEIALEKARGIQQPFFITSERKATENARE